MRVWGVRVRYIRYSTDTHTRSFRRSCGGIVGSSASSFLHPNPQSQQAIGDVARDRVPPRLPFAISCTWVPLYVTGTPATKSGSSKLQTHYHDRIPWGGERAPGRYGSPIRVPKMPRGQVTVSPLNVMPIAREVWLYFFCLYRQCHLFYIHLPSSLTLPSAPPAP
jgi:hypothetical protein